MSGGACDLPTGRSTRLLWVNDDWALVELQKFLDLLEFRDKPGLYAATYVGTGDEIVAQMTVVERIWEHVIGPKPVVSVSAHDRYRGDRDWAVRCVASIKREAEIRENLGLEAPDLNAGNMHKWVWEGAHSLWHSGHFREAVEAAAKKVNAETQNKVGRRDVAETDLFMQSFSDDEPQIGRPRLRMFDDDHGKTSNSPAVAFELLLRGVSLRSGTQLHTTAENLAKRRRLSSWRP